MPERIDSARASLLPSNGESDYLFLSLFHGRVSFLNARFLITDIIGQCEVKEIEHSYVNKSNTLVFEEDVINRRLVLTLPPQTAELYTKGCHYELEQRCKQPTRQVKAQSLHDE